MQKYLLLIFIVFIFTKPNSSYGQLWLGEVAHWDMNGSVQDVSGHGHNGTAYGVTNAVGKDGVSNTAYYFNGSAYITIPFATDLNVSEFSVAAIIKPTAFYTGVCQGNAILVRGTQYTSGNYGLYFTDNAFDGDDCFHVDTNDYLFEAMAGQTVYYSYNYQYTPTIRTNRWYTVVTTYGNNVVKVYVDGILKSTTPITYGSLGTSTEGISIGKNLYGGTSFPYPFTGYIDDIRLYNRVLHDSDVIAYSRNLYLTPPFKDTVLCAGSTFNLNYTCKNIFNPGNIFTAQISDSAGSFASPVNIGAVASNATGTISCTLPASLPLGSGYRIRVVANSPADTSFDNGSNILIHNTYAIPTANSNSPVCAGDTLELSVSSSPLPSYYKWTGPAITGSIVGYKVYLHSVGTSAAGNYVVESNNKGCVSFDTVSVAVSNTPTIYTTDTIRLCADDSLRLSGISNTSGASFLWKGPNGFTASRSDTTINNTTASDAGVYLVSASFNGCTSKPDTSFVIINPRPAPEVTNNSPLCEGDSLLFTVKDTLGNVQYLWAGPNGYSSTMKHPVITNTTNANNGTYILTATSDKNCSATINSVAIIKPLPIQAKTSNNSPICTNNDLLLTADGSAGCTWQWSGPNGFNSTDKNPVIQNVQMSGQGTYYVKASLNGCISNDSTLVMLNLTPATPVASSNSPVLPGHELMLSVTTTTPGVSYKWTGPNGFGSLAQNPVISKATPAAAGTYTVVTTLGECSASAVTIVLVKTESTADTFVLYPNPNDGKFTLLSNTDIKTAMPVEIINETGQVVLRDILEPVNNRLNHIFNIQDKINKGVYYLRISINGVVRTITFSITK